MKEAKQSNKMRWTQEQEKVIQLRNRNILVSAAAGSGKTAVLVERIIQMVTDTEHPMDIDRLLIVTFTNAAAAEMRERIGLAIEKKLMEYPEDEHLQKQMTLIHSAQITTTHSFCLNVIRNNFNQIDLDPTFRIGEDAELKLMQSDVIASILEEEYEKGEEAFLQFVESYSSSKSDEMMEGLILQLYRFSMSYPWPREWLSQLIDVFDLSSVEELREASFMKVLLDYTSSVVLELQHHIEEAIAIAEESDGPDTYLPTLYQDKEQLERLLQCQTYEEYYNTLNGLSFGRLSAKKSDGVDEEKKEQVKQLRNGIKKIKDDLIDDYYFQREEEMLADLQAVKTVMAELVRLTLRFDEEYRRLKEEKTLVDFNDLEHMALRILVNKEDGVATPTAVAEELSEFYEEIMIDEYQDSNLVQETILNSISKERLGRPNVFMVGDVKQSIYKFRLARPELFMEKYETYTVEDSPYQKIDLHKNFRSRAIVLDCINYICEQIMTKKLGNIEYDEDAALYPGAEFPETEEHTSKESELILVTLSEKEQAEPVDSLNESEIDSVDEEEEEFTKKELEAKAIAMRIKELVEGEQPLHVLDKAGYYRKATYKDIVILLRTMSNWADVFVDALLSEGIPAYADTASGYFKTLEIKTILNMLRIIDNPLQDIPYTAVLHSPMGGFTHEELAQLRDVDRDAMMHTIVTACAQGEGEISQELVHKCKRFHTLLEELRSFVYYSSIHELILHVLEKTHYYDFVSAMPAGVVRKANIDMLVQKAVSFEATSYKGLFHFVRYIEKLHKYDVDFGEASVSNENDDTVRIMSIHKSKGLEFPIVFVSGMGKSFNNQDARSKIVIHPELGIGPDVIDLELRVKAPTLVKKVIQKMQVLENLGEELRVLYVALTRAKEKLIITGFVPDIEKIFHKYERVQQQIATQLNFIQLTSASTFLDYLIPSMMRHQSVFQTLYAYCGGETSGGESPQGKVPMQCRIVSPSCLIAAERKKQVVQEVTKEMLYDWDAEVVHNQAIREQIHEILEYSYPYQREVELHAKLTVSELKRLRQKAMQEESIALYDQEEKEDTEVVVKDTEAIIPKFMREEEIVTGAARGTLYHKVLEEMDLFAMTSMQQIEEAIKDLIAQDKIPAESLQKVNRYQLYQFTKSSLARRMKRAKEAGQLYREQQFVIGIEANEINESYLSDEIMLVQGIIDVFFEEEDGLVIMDYKTDIVRSGDEMELVHKYGVQLEYYKKALEQMTGKVVKETIIYSFSLGKEVVVTFNP